MMSIIIGILFLIQTPYTAIGILFIIGGFCNLIKTLLEDSF